MTEDWREQARCREVGADIFFPEYQMENIEVYRMAVSVCQRCEVRAECYAYARDNNEMYGIWGGHYASQINRAKRKGENR